jgi:hypothetical protein
MIAAFGDLDICGVTRRCQHPRGGLVIEIVRQISNRTVPGFARKAALRGPSISLGSGIQNPKWRTCRWRRDSRSSKDVIQLARPDDCVYLRDALANLVAEAFDQAACHHQFPGTSFGLVPRHLQDSVHRLLLRAGDKRAGVDYDDVSILGPRNQIRSRLRQHPHHHFAVHQVLGTPQAHEAHLERRQRRFFSGHGFVFGPYSSVRKRHAIFIF